MSNFEPLPSFSGEPSEVHGGQPEYAQWFPRVGAFVLDGILVFVAATVVAAVTGHHDLFNTLKFQKVNGTERVVPYGSELDFFIIAEGVLSLAYTIGFLSSKWQATLGMRACGIYIAKEGDLGPVTLGRAAGRSVLFLGVSSVLQLVVRAGAGLVVLVDLLWPLWDSRNQTLHDKVAKTVVLRRTGGR
jgi:uncharacterized RDD family membrane protein YckC